MTLDLRRALYGSVVFGSAVLLLIIQPIVAKAILPWFGGSAGVWTTCMLFFQVILLLGYGYVHLLRRTFPPRVQAWVHCALLLASIPLLPVSPSAAWKPVDGSDPVFRILALLTTSAGLPCFLLAATSPLLQAWYTQTGKERLPWRLFALSNLGSVVALLAYPFGIEPRFTVTAQLHGWSSAFLVFAGLCGGLALSNPQSVPDPADTAELPSRRTLLTWLALSATPSVLWLAVANQMTQDVAAIPFLWILPFTLYLLSFVLTFDSDRWYRPRAFRWILPLAWVALLVVVAVQGFFRLWWTIGLFSLALFSCCMFCHGELARLRPNAKQLTAYYLTLAVGGALGGAFVALIAPRLFTEFLELPLSILGCILLALWLLYRLSDKRVLRIGAVAAAGTVTALLTRSTGSEHIVSLRNFYGTLQSSDSGFGFDRYRSLFNGTIQHGIQFVDSRRSKTPTTYYGMTSGAAVTLRLLEAKGPVRVGVIGLGIGTMATWARPGDHFRFYEINPAVIGLARTEFTYLKDSAAKPDIVEGDARLSMEREQPQNFDLLVLDAFSGDSIPVHLLTREAFALWFRHLAPGGAIAVHVTNKHLDLAPVVKLAANDSHAHALILYNDRDDRMKVSYSVWVIVTKNDELDRRLTPLAGVIRGSGDLRLWTDDYSNLFTILKRAT